MPPKMTREPLVMFVTYMYTLFKCINMSLEDRRTKFSHYTELKHLFVCLCAGKPKQKSMGKAVKTPSMNWTEALPAPPSFGELEQCVLEDLPIDDHEDMELG